MRASFVLVMAFVGPVVGLAACGDDDAAQAEPPGDGGASEAAPVVVTNDKESKQSGKIVKAREATVGVGGATIAIAGKTATANASGEYEIVVPRNTPYQMTVTAPEYFKFLDQEWIVKKEAFARGESQLLPVALGQLLAGLLPGRDATKGILVVRVYPRPPCESEEGSVVAIEPAGQSMIRYFEGGLPASSRTSVKKDEGISVGFYNVDVGVPLKVTVNSPLCASVPFPVEADDVTYTGVQKAEPGDALSYMRMYLGPKKAADAGSDAPPDAPDGG